MTMLKSALKRANAKTIPRWPSVYATRIWNVSVLPALRELTAAIAEKRELQRGATFVDGLRNQMVLDAVTASTASRKWEDLDMSEAC